MSNSNTQPMPRHPLFNAIVAKHFFENYCPKVRNWKHKLRGKDGNNNPIEFSKEDRAAIKSAVHKLTRDLNKMDDIFAQ